MKHKIILMALAAALLPLGAAAQANLNGGYVFSTGTSQAAWIDISSENSSLIAPGAGNAASGVYQIGFPFTFADSTYELFSANAGGVVRLGGTAVSNVAYLPLTGGFFNYLGSDLPKIVAMGTNGYVHDGGYCRYALLGEEGSRVLVIEFKVRVQNQSTNDEQELNFEVQLFEQASQVRLVYGSCGVAPSQQRQIGLVASTTDWVRIDDANHVAQFGTSSSGTTTQSAANTWPGEWRYYSFAVPSADCPMPTGVTVQGIGASTATVGWTPGGSESLWAVYLDGTLVGTTSATTYTLTALQASTSYTVGVGAICAEGDTSLGSSVTFLTDCAPIDTLPWTDGFEDYATGSLPLCYSHASAGDAANSQVQVQGGTSANQRHSGSLGLKMTHSIGGNLLLLPEFEEPVSNLELKLWHRPQSKSNTSSGTLQAGYVTNPADTASFVPTASWICTGFDTLAFRLDQATFGGAPAGSRIALRHKSNNTSYYWLVDDLTVQAAPQCDRPTLAVAATTPTSITLTLNDANATGHYKLWTEGGDDTLEVHGFEYTMEYLEPGVLYNIVAATMCDSVSISLTQTLPVRTDCDSIRTLPWTDNMDSYTAMLGTYGRCSDEPTVPCYGFLPGNDSLSCTFLTNNLHRYGDAGLSLGFRPGTEGASSILVLPPTEVQLATLELAFQSSPSDNTANSGSIDVGYITDPTDAGTFVGLRHIEATDYDSAAYALVVQHFIGAPAGARAALRHNGAVDYGYWFVDELELHEAVGCLTPALTIDSLGADAATVAIAGNAPVYEVIFGTDTTQTADTLIALDGLQPNTTYTIQATALCQNGLSSTTGSLTFTTPCAAEAFPFHYTQTEMMAQATIDTLSFGFADCWQSNHYSLFTTGQMAYAFSNEADATLGLPPVAAGLDSVQLRTTASTTATGARLMVGVAEDEGIMWIDTIDIDPTSGMTDVQEYEISLAAYTGTSNRVVVGNASGSSIFLGEFHIEPISSCHHVGHLTATEADTNSISVDWTAGAYEGQWVVYLDGSVAATVDTNHYTFGNLPPQSMHTIGVRALCGEGDTSLLRHIYASTTADTVPILQPCDAPTALTATAVDSTSATIDWTSTAASWKVSVNGGAETTVSSHPHTLTGLTPQTQYTVRVKAVCADGQESDWATVSFTTTEGNHNGEPSDTTGIGAVLGTTFALYPNPATSTVTVEVGEAARLSVIDMSGRTVYNDEIRNSKFEISVSTLPRGTYFVRVSTATGTAVRKLVVE